MQIRHRIRRRLEKSAALAAIFLFVIAWLHSAFAQGNTIRTPAEGDSGVLLGRLVSL